MIKKNENENVQDRKHIDINNNILMKIHAISCIGTFYSFVAMITITLNKFSALWELVTSKCNVNLNMCLFPDIFSMNKLPNYLTRLWED